MPKDKKRIAVIGFGAMVQSLRTSFRNAGNEYEIGATLVPKESAPSSEVLDGVELFFEAEDLLRWGPSLVVECASHQAVQQSVPVFLRAGIDTIIVSIGSLSDPDLLSTLESAATEGQSRLVVVSGAIGGLDVLRAARIGGLDSVVYTGTKPPQAWRGTRAEEAFMLDGLVGPTVIFRGTAAEAARAYPKNANVTAAVALAGVGFSDTAVTLVADPAAFENKHEVVASGAFGQFSIALLNKPLPNNPKTSWLAALSIEQAVVSQFQPMDL